MNAQEALPTQEHVDAYLRYGVTGGASDVHLGPNVQPIWRLNGTLKPIWDDAAILTAEDTKKLAMSFLGEEQLAILNQKGDVDFAYANDASRFRASVVRQRLGYELVFRVINTRVRSMDELGLSTQLKMLTQYHNGLILVTGAVGSGKSTTLAAFMDEINKARHDHIITLEDPIEYIMESKSCHVTQREVHSHTESFGAALRGALREDPDIIMVGEMRDLETISLAITASETGHLVLGTLHTSMPRARWIACSTSSPSINANRSASWSANPCAASSASSSSPRKTALAGCSPWRS